MNVLPVSYVSQIMSGALEHNNDCGSASSLMLLRTYGLAKTVTVDQFYNSIVPSGDVALSAGSMQNKMANYGLFTDWAINTSAETLFGYLRNRKPVLALIHYGTLVDAGLTEKTGFRGAHFLVVTGIDLEDVFIDDPYRDDGRINIPVLITTFQKAWKDCTLDNNPIGGCIIPRSPIQDLSTTVPSTDEYYIVSTINGLNVRILPDANSALVRTIWRVNEPTVHVLVSTLTNGYVRLSNGTGWVWFTYLIKK